MLSFPMMTQSLTSQTDGAVSLPGVSFHRVFRRAGLAAGVGFLLGLGLMFPSASVRATEAAAPIEGELVDRVWAGHRVGFALLAERGHQFIAYYDGERKLTVVGRKLGDTAWVRVQPPGVPVPERGRMSNVTGWDSHNRLVLALDRDGCVHLSGNMHNDPLVYYRTRAPFDLTTLERIDRMTGQLEEHTTYPVFMRDLDGRLIYKYRDGGSGNGSDLYNVYDADTRTWRRLFDGPLLDGEGERSAYGTGPRPGPDGLFHMVWMWRDTPDALSNHTLSYARSPDMVNWQDSQGRPVARPLRMANSEVIDPTPAKGGLVNMCYQFGWDAKQRPVVTYHRFDDKGRSQLFIARPRAEGGWLSRQLTAWDFRWDFSGSGSQEREVNVTSPKPDAQGNLLVGYSSRTADSGRWRIDAETLEILEKLPPERDRRPVGFDQPRGDYPGLSVQSTSAEAEGRHWLLRWETMGVNRELKDRPAPPPSELRLIELSAAKER